MMNRANQEVAASGRPILCPATIPRSDVDPEWIEQVRDARTMVSLLSPLIAYQMYQCDIEFSRELPTKTAGALIAPDRNIIYFDPDWYCGQPAKPRALIMMHETLHIFLEHQIRRIDMGYDRALWAAATDYYINPICLGMYKDEDGYGVSQVEKYKKYVEMPLNPDGSICGLYDERFIGMSADEIYWYMLEDCKGNKKAAREKWAGGDIEDGDNVFGAPSEGDADGEGSGKSKKSPKKLFDWQADAEGSRAQTNRNRRTSSAAIARGEAEKSIGENEAGMARHMRGLFRPKVSWTDQITDLARASVKERSTHNRVSRRSGGGDIIFPAKTGERLSAVFGVDTSGSMSEDELNEAAAEFRGIMEQFLAWEVHLISCDVEPTEIGSFTSELGDSFSAKNVQLVGGGGTDMTPIVKHTQNLLLTGKEINVCIVVTDGYVPDIGVHIGSECQYIFLVTTGGNRSFSVPGAEVLFMDNMG